MDKLTTRKFLMTSAAMFMTFVALFFGKFTGDQAVTLLTLELGIFVGGNVVAKHKAFTEGK